MVTDAVSLTGEDTYTALFILQPERLLFRDVFDDNPAPIFLENGTVLLYAKMACNETVNPRSAACYQYGLLRAPHWRGPWTFVRMIEVYGEDVAAWRDQRGNYRTMARFLFWSRLCVVSLT